MSHLCRSVAVAAAICAAPLAAQLDIPAALEPWRDWVLQGEEYRACPVRNGTMPGERGNHVCAWPGTLTVDATNNGAEFVQTWTVYADDWVPLPGNRELWPFGVTVGTDAEAVVERGGRPMLRLARGTHRVAGRLAWASRPASIGIPPETGLVALRLDAQAVANPYIEAATLWLGLRADAEVEEDRLDVIVHRHLQDSLPMSLTTVVTLDIAGQSREIALTGAALAGFTSEALESELPVQLMPDGVLRVQVRPGTWEVRLTARSPIPVATLQRAATVEPWPADEIWSFEPEPRLRVAALEGADPVDANRSGVPGEWQELPAYRVTDSQQLTVVERSRSDAAEPNRLTLRRALWLDFDGGGYTAHDDVSGSMSSRWRLDMAQPYTMTMASVNEENLLVTQGLEAGLQGVELRAESIELTTTSRIERSGSLPVTGYRETFDEAATTLHLPPGYRLLAAPGADRAAGAWIERWRLLDIFLLLVITAAVWRLFGPVPGVVAFVTLVVVFHEPWAPRWAWLNLLVAIALLRVLPVGKLRWVVERYRFASLAALLLLLVPFTIEQLRTALHVQLERPTLDRDVSYESKVAFNQFAPAAAPLARTRALDSLESAVEEIIVTGSRIGDSGIARYQPGALVQTGPGLPDWGWTRHNLSFGGPVTADQTVRFMLLGPAGVALWRLASVALALLLLFALAGGELKWPPRLSRASLAPLLLIAGLLGLGAPDDSRAQAADGFPSQALLDDLKRRLTQPEPCHPTCAALTAATVTVAGNALTVALDVALQAEAAVPFPSVPRGWRPTTVTIDGSAAGFVFRDPGEVLWLRVDDGVHRIELRGPLPEGDNLSLPFPLPPRRIAATAPGWDVAGIVDGRLPSGTLELTRQRDAAAADGALGGTVFPPFVSVVRRIAFDIDWRVTTTLTRVAPETGAFTLPVALLPNEAVLTPGIEVSNGQATVAFASDEDEVFWESRLPTAATLTLAAPANAAWAESWQFAVGYIWHAEYAGLPATAAENPDPSFHVAEYYPRPGETLTVTLTRPEAASGDTIAIDSVDYAREVGARTAVSTLDLYYRSTRGDEHVITLPEGAELESVEIDGDSVPLMLDGRTLGLPVTPGEHDASIVWREPTGVGFRTDVPPVDVGGGATNVTLTLDLPADRWTLFTFGPTLGPAVLYWPELLALVLGAFVLGRLPLKPLRTYEWLLLGFGLSTFAWPVLFLFAAWALALAWRGSREIGWPERRFNALQIGLGFLTVVALASLVAAIPTGLLGRPDMQVVSPVEYGSLDWFVDRTSAVTPSAGVISVSLWFYRAAMLAWALWLSLALLRWLPWAWRAYSHGGWWRTPPPRPSRRNVAPGAPSAPA